MAVIYDRQCCLTLRRDDDAMVKGSNSRAVNKSASNNTCLSAAQSTALLGVGGAVSPITALQIVGSMRHQLSELQNRFATGA